MVVINLSSTQGSDNCSKIIYCLIRRIDNCMHLSTFLACFAWIQTSQAATWSRIWIKTLIFFFMAFINTVDTGNRIWLGCINISPPYSFSFYNSLNCSLGFPFCLYGFGGLKILLYFCITFITETSGGLWVYLQIFSHFVCLYFVIYNTSLMYRPCHIMLLCCFKVTFRI